MCDPITAGLVLAAGTGAQVLGQRRSEKATERYTGQVQDAEARRQEDLRQRRMAELQKALDSSGIESTRERMSDAKDTRMQDYADVEARGREERGYSEAPSARTGAAKIVQGEFDRESAEAGADVTQQADARARLASFGDANLSNALAMQPLKENISKDARFARNSAGVMDYELQDAVKRGQAKGKNLQLLGDVLSMGGSMGMNAAAFSGAAGGSGGAGAAGTAGTAAGNSDSLVRMGKTRPNQTQMIY